MIIPAVKRGNGGQLAAYLLNETKNERAELLDMRGFANPRDLRTGLLSIELEAKQTKSDKPFYHAAIRVKEGERLTPEQLKTSVAKLEHRLGLTGQARAIVEHQYKGGTHWHVVWSLVDRERGKLIELPFDAEKRVEVARNLEKAFGLRELAPAHAPKQARLRRADYEQADRLHRPVADIRDVKGEIRDAWNRSDNGAAFTAALKERHLVLAIGDRARKALGVVDEYGTFHVLTRTVEARVKEVRAKLTDLEHDQLPTVEQARDALAAQTPTHDKAAPEHRPATTGNDARDQVERAIAPEEPGREHDPLPAVEQTCEAPAAQTPTHDRAVPEHGDATTGQETPDERATAPEPDHAPAGGLRVFDDTQGITSGVGHFAAAVLDGLAKPAEGLAEGIANMFGATPTQRPQAAAPAHPRKSTLDTLKERDNARRALRNISESVKQGQDLNAADLRALPRSEIESLRHGGDEYLLRLVQHFERERAERDKGRERER